MDDIVNNRFFKTKPPKQLKLCWHPLWNIFSASFKFIHIRNKGKRGAIIIFPHSVQIPEYFMQYNNNLSKVKKRTEKRCPTFSLATNNRKTFYIFWSVFILKTGLMWIMRMNHELSVWIMRIMCIIYKTFDIKFDSAKNSLDKRH